MTEVNSARQRNRSERLETRVTVDQKRLIERAAAIQGRTLTDFVIASVQDAALRAIEDHHRVELSARDSAAFVEALMNAAPVNASSVNASSVNDRLIDTVRKYRQTTGV